MKTKQNKLGQMMGTGVAVMLLVGAISSAVAACMIGNGMVPDAMGNAICWIMTTMGAYIVSWYTAKSSNKNKLQISIAVIGIYLCICLLVGRLAFSECDLELSVWIAILIGASAAGSAVSCMKKERKR